MKPFKIIHFILFFILLLIIPICHAQNWEVIDHRDAQTGQHQCVLQSRSHSLFDGYGDTNISLKIFQDRLLVKTDSNIDATGKALTVKIDNNTKQFTGRLSNKTDIVFDQEFEQIISQFIAGNKTILSLQFWPTWPNTKVYQATFSLVGFTKVYKTYRECLAQ